MGRLLGRVGGVDLFQFYNTRWNNNKNQQSLTIALIIYKFQALIKNIAGMQVQKHLFRIAEKSNKSDNAQLCWSIIYIISLILGIAALTVFGIGELVIKNDLHTLQNCFRENGFTLQADEIGVILNNGAKEIEDKIKNSTPLNNDSAKIRKYCSIYKNLNTSEVSQDNLIVMTGMYSLFRMERKERSLLKFDNYTFVFEQWSFLTWWVYQPSILISNEIVQVADSSRLKEIINSTEIYVKAPLIRFSYSEPGQNGNVDNVLTRLRGIAEIVFTYAVASVITSLYIYVTIISSPAVILLFLQLTPYGRTEGFFQAFKAFPWIGMHSLIFRGSTKPIVRQAYISICSSLIIYFFVMYLGYYTIVIEISNLFFEQPMENGVGQLLFGYFAIVQFAALVFMRTRPFLKYFPVINTLFVFFFMLYCKFSHVGFKIQAVLGMQFLGIALFSWMVLKLQIPAQKAWLPTREFVPNLKQPRAGLMPAFNLNWINALPDEWTMMMPLMSREKFTQKELAFVDQNYEQLAQHLNQH